MMTDGSALEGLRVADFSWAIAGPVASKYLALHGATVIKIETHKRLDGPRMAPPFAGRPHRDRSGYFANHNAGKRSVTLDLSHPEGRVLAHRLVEWADVTAENFAPGVAARLGCDYPTLKSVNPRIVHVSASMQGQQGPHATHPGFGLTLQALAGLSHFTGWPDRAPLGIGEPYTDLIAPWFQVAAVLAALERRDRTGEGCFIDLSQLETTLHFFAPALLDHAVNGVQEARRGNADDVMAPHGVFPCAPDGLEPEAQPYIAIVCEDDGQWQALRRLMDDPEWARHPDYETVAGRLRHSAVIESKLSQWTADQDVAALAERLQAAGVAAGVVATGRDLFADPQLAHRGHFVRLKHAAMGEHAYDAPGFHLSETPAQMRPAPSIGEANEEVLGGILGLSAEEQARLREIGAVG
ncbi:MAG: CoA transferase [Chloroflexi bacterium]|nr:MAG: CoA transferase [Chloroflexota bacterium]